MRLENLTNLSDENRNAVHKIVKKSLDHFSKTQFKALGEYFFERAKLMNIDIKEFRFLTESVAACSWDTLDFTLQNKIVKLMWCCSFIFIKPLNNRQEVIQEFMQLWDAPINQPTVAKMTEFMIQNISSKDPILLHNLFGLMHDPATHNGSHFANKGSVQDLFTHLFPFILSVIANKVPEIPICSAVMRNLNEFQLLQGIEMNVSMLAHFANGSKPVWRGVDFGSKECKSVYLSKLSSTSTANNPHHFVNQTMVHSQAAKTCQIPHHQLTQSYILRGSTLYPISKPFYK